MRNRMYGGVRGRKTKVGGNYFVFLLLDCTEGRDRTGTSVTSSVFETDASTDSATSAWGYRVKRGCKNTDFFIHSKHVLKKM